MDEITVKENTVRKIQCGGCNRYFAGDYAHEMHRTGDISLGQRRCMTEAEMREKGMDCEKKSVRMIVENKRFVEVHDVWFSVAKREQMREHFASASE